MRYSARRALLLACLLAATALRAEEPASATVAERILAVVNFAAREARPVILDDESHATHSA